MSRERFHVLADKLLDLRLEGDGVAGRNAETRAVGLAAVHQHVSVRDDLTGRPDGPGHPGAADGVVEAALQDAKKHLARVARHAGRIRDVATELALEDAIVELELLLLVEADAVVPQPPSAVAVHSRRVELAF